MTQCERCPHDAHVGKMCGGYNLVDIRDDVGIFAPPSGRTVTLIDSICRCIVIGLQHSGPQRPAGPCVMKADA